MADREYDTDLALWADSQARALRDASHAGTNLPIDWENVAEAIEALAKSQARELAGRTAIVLVHLMKLEASPAREPRAGWQETIAQQRGDIERVLADSSSLRPTVPRKRAGEEDANFGGLGLEQLGQRGRVVAVASQGRSEFVDGARQHLLDDLGGNTFLTQAEHVVERQCQVHLDLQRGAQPLGQQIGDGDRSRTPAA